MLAAVIESHTLCHGNGPAGSSGSGRRDRATEDDRAAIDSWVGNWLGTNHQMVGPLQDAGYDAPCSTQTREELHQLKGRQDATQPAVAVSNEPEADAGIVTRSQEEISVVIQADDLRVHEMQ